MIALPRRHLAALEDLAAKVLERRGAGCQLDTIARDLLSGFFDVCMDAGLDGVLVELEGAFASLEIADETALSEEPRFQAALTARLSDRRQFDPGGPRAAMPRQLADCLLASLSLTLSDPADRTILLSDAVRREVLSALASAVDAALAVPQVRAAIISTGRALCEPQYLGAFEQLAGQLDERGMRLPPQPTMPLHAVQAVKRVLFDARTEVVERAACDAMDRAIQVLARTNSDAAARIDQPISHRTTPRDASIRRLRSLRVPKPEVVAESLLASLSELAELAWEEPEPPARTYSPRDTFAVGDVLDHPTFGRGTVQATWERSIDVEFEDGWHTLVHSRSR
jgi:hypothetical protein